MRKDIIFKPVAIAAMIATFGATAAYAQTSPPATAPHGAMDSTVPGGADASKLIGRNVQNAQGETIGEIKSIYLGKDGKVDSVLVGVGGFLGMGDREVKVAWKDLNIMNNGEKVTVNMTKDQLKSAPEYKYSSSTYRGHVFNDAGIWKDRPAAASSATTTNAPTMAANTGARPDAASTVSTGDFNANGEISSNAIIGASVKNNAKESIGTVEDTYVDKDGAIKAVIVSVGGFLGIGDKHVAVKWSDIKFSRDDKDVVLTTDWTKDKLKAMPDYKYQRRVPAARAG